MKISVIDIVNKYDVDLNLDLTKYIKESHEIISIEKCLVKGSLENIYEEINMNIDVKVELTLSSARSFKPINYKLDFNLDLLFGNSKDSDYALEENIYLSEIIYGHILLEKPLTIYAEDEHEIVEDIRKINPAFATLKDF